MVTSGVGAILEAASLVAAVRSTHTCAYWTLCRWCLALPCSPRCRCWSCHGRPPLSVSDFSWRSGCLWPVAAGARSTSLSTFRWSASSSTTASWFCKRVAPGSADGKKADSTTGAAGLPCSVSLGWLALVRLTTASLSKPASRPECSCSSILGGDWMGAALHSYSRGPSHFSKLPSRPSMTHVAAVAAEHDHLPILAP